MRVRVRVRVRDVAYCKKVKLGITLRSFPRVAEDRAFFCNDQRTSFIWRLFIYFEYLLCKDLYGIWCPKTLLISAKTVAFFAQRLLLQLEIDKSGPSPDKSQRRILVAITFSASFKR